MATHSSILAWRTPWTEEPGGLLSQGYKESDSTEHLNKKDNSPVHLAISCYHLAASYGCYPAWSLKTAEFAVPK